MFFILKKKNEKKTVCWRRKEATHIGSQEKREPRKEDKKVREERTGDEAEREDSWSTQRSLARARQ